MVNYYEQLGISEDETPEQIKKAYRTLAKKLHPDMNRGEDTTEAFIALEVAYSCLTDIKARRAYDRLLEMERERISNPGLNRKYAQTIRRKTTRTRKRAHYHSNLSYAQYQRDEKINNSLLGIVLKLIFFITTAVAVFWWVGVTTQTHSEQVRSGIEPDISSNVILLVIFTPLPLLIGLSYLYEPLVKRIIIGRPKRKK